MATSGGTSAQNVPNNCGTYLASSSAPKTVVPIRTTNIKVSTAIILLFPRFIFFSLFLYLITVSKSLIPPVLAQWWDSDFETRPYMSIKVERKLHDMRILG